MHYSYPVPEGYSESASWIPRVTGEAMAMALSGELFKEPLTISDSARADALACLDTWDYDTLALQEASGGHALLLVGEALFEWHKLHEPCHVDRAVLHRFLRALEACYGDHEYHNAMHGADVALGVHHFIVNFGLTARLTKLELLAALVGALVHDFDHPGTNNGHEVRAGTERALMHTDAILEHHHLHSTFKLLATPDFDLFGAMPADDRELCRKLIVDMVLATDLKRHDDFISTLSTLAAQHGATAAGALPSLENFTSPFQAQALVGVPLLLAVALKFADLSHCFKPFHIHKHWVERITNEFWALGDRERQLGIAVSPLCDRDKDSNVPKSQIGFFNFICVPFYSIVADLIDPTMLPWLRVQANLQEWGRSR
jgi:cAMP-specific phosphodiesterase 4